MSTFFFSIICIFFSVLRNIRAPKPQWKLNLCLELLSTRCAVGTWRRNSVAGRSEGANEVWLKSSTHAGVRDISKTFHLKELCCWDKLFVSSCSSLSLSFQSLTKERKMLKHTRKHWHPNNIFNVTALSSIHLGHINISFKCPDPVSVSNISLLSICASYSVKASPV